MSMNSKLRLPAMAVSILSLASLAGCVTPAAQEVQLRPADLHFPTRMVDNLDDNMLKTMRGDLVMEGNCLYLTNIKGELSTRKYVVTWPSNSKIERTAGTAKSSKLEVVSASAEFNDNTRSITEIPARIEFLGMLKNEPFTHASRFKTTSTQGCKSDYYAPIRTWRRVGGVSG